MTKFHTNLEIVRARIHQAANAAGRSPQDIKMIAASKMQPEFALRDAYANGINFFGENYVQEALPKILAMQDLPVEWHFIGPIQSNKTTLIAAHFDWVHSIDRVKIAQRLSLQRPAHLPPLNVCLQMNVSGESSKSGVPPEEIAGLARAVNNLPSLRLRGLMSIPEPTPDPAQQAARFKVVRQCLEKLNSEGFSLDTLSMGMSSDLEAAIAQGATLVRIGTALFGERRAQNSPEPN